ncbi:MAG: UDP-3-O-(3-hydroxymyristoyl)glucosamine N-acyltransferase [Flavobacteriales bacterium]
MKFNSPQTLAQLAEFLKCEYMGPADHLVLGTNEIHRVEKGDLVFVDHPKYYQKALESAATTVLINQKTECPAGKGLLISDDPCRDFNKLNRHFAPGKIQSAAVGENVKIAATAVIYPNVFIGHNVSIGENSIIYPGVCIYAGTTIGRNVTIHANTVIGSDAFYYKKRDEIYDKMYTCGNVVIEDEVEIGAGCTIDRGLTADTRIGKGSKIDNLVQIGHDTVIGKNCLFAAQVGIAGCVVIEDNVTLWGQVGVISGITIGKGVVVMAQSGVGMSLEPGKKYFGSPADDARIKYREYAAVKSLPDFLDKKNK